ncbi:hypothetical protein [Dactylosporangium sp. NPDC000521]|uniref:hypothetical protein n=1 Tax=Dactylosporangium sp. NPDC000521 TaxID=3363975 RepID=UPI0036CD1588
MLTQRLAAVEARVARCRQLARADPVRHPADLGLALAEPGAVHSRRWCDRAAIG